jgi:hypothetical protein
MSHPIQITIPTACHENWDTMAPAEKGRHCAACQKTVVDFTDMTDADILRQLKKASALPSARHPGAELCGRFMPNQLNRQLIPPPPLAGKIHFRGWQWVLTGLLLTADAVPHRNPRPPMQEQPHKKIIREEATVGLMLFPISETIPPPIETLDTPTATMGTPAITILDSLPKSFDSLVMPTCLPKADTTEGIALMGEPLLTAADTLPVVASRDPAVIADSPLPGISDAADPSTVHHLRIYPNPLRPGSSYRLQWPDNPGRYQLTLFNSTGALIQQTVVEITTPQQPTEHQLPSALTPGIYILRAARPGQAKPYTAKLVVN